MWHDRRMSGEIRLRDHTRPCEHGRLWAHWGGARPKWWQEPDCPGGAEVVLRRRADGTWEEVPADAPEHPS
jgi:hypothetical protein